MLLETLEQRELLAVDAPATGRPRAVIVPHAGYIYSGQVAADAWRQVQGLDIDLVVVLGGFVGTAILARFIERRGS